MFLAGRGSACRVRCANHPIVEERSAQWTLQSVSGALPDISPPNEKRPAFLLVS